jgi:hypothetical protein
VNGFVRRAVAHTGREDGVSLVEILIALTITAIIIIPLGGAIFFGFRTTGETQTRLWESGKANVMSSFFLTDVQNASIAQKNVLETAGACGTARPVAVALLLTSPDGSSVSYYRGSASVAGENTNYLYRKACGGGTNAVQPLILDLAGTPVFNCAPVTNCNATWASVSAQFTQQDVNGKNQYATTIQAAKRVT